MVDHLSLSQVDDYCRRRLSVPELLAVSDHIAVCDSCRARVEGGLDGTTAFFRVRASVFAEPQDETVTPEPATHPDIEQMSKYVDGSLAGDELQSVKDHAALCETCALAIADLSAFRNRVVETLGREYRPGAGPASEGMRLDHPARSLWSLFMKSPAWGLAALAVALLAGSGVLVWRPLARREIKGPVAVAPTSAAPTQAPPAIGDTGRVLAQLDDGGRHLVLDQGGRLSGADELPPAYRQFIRSALAGEPLGRSPQLSGLIRPASSLMGGREQQTSFTLSEPIGTVVLSARPLFRWSSLPGASGYYVEVYDGHFNLASLSHKLSGTSWTPTSPLKRGVVYSWQVSALKNGQEFKSPLPPAPQAKFRVANKADADEIAQARRNYPSSHLLLGILCVRAGMISEAEREFQSLQTANPDSAAVAGLLARLRTMQR